MGVSGLSAGLLSLKVCIETPAGLAPCIVVGEGQTGTLQITTQQQINAEINSGQLFGTITIAGQVFSGKGQASTFVDPPSGSTQLPVFAGVQGRKTGTVFITGPGGSATQGPSAIAPVTPSFPTAPTTPTTSAGPSDPWNPVSWVQWFGALVTAGLTALGAVIVQGFNVVMGPLIDAVRKDLVLPILRAAGWLESIAGKLDWSGIEKALGDLWNLLIHPLDWFTPILALLGEWSGHSLKSASPPVLVRGFKPADTKETDVPWPWGGVVDAFRAITGDFEEQISRWTDALRGTTSTGTPAWKTNFDSVAKPFVDRHISAVQELLKIENYVKSPLSVEDAQRAAAAIGGGAIPLTLGIWLTGAASEAATLGQWRSVKELWDMLFLDLGFAGSMRSAILMPLDVAVFPRAQQFYRKLSRPVIPPTIIADQMLHRGNITDTEWAELYSLWGWTDQHQQAWSKSFYRIPREFLLARLVDVMPDILEKARSWLAKSPYSSEDVDFLLTAFLKLALKDEVSALKTADVKDFAGGWVSESQLEKNLKDLDQNPDEVQLVLAKARAELQRSNRDLHVKILKKDFVLANISDLELGRALTRLGLQPDRVTLEVDEAKQDVKTGTPKQSSAAEIKRLFQDGFRTAEDYKAALLGQGTPEVDANNIVQDAALATLRDERAALATQALDDFLKLHADPGLLRNDLEALLFREEEIELRIARAESQYQRTLALQFVDIYTKGRETEKLTAQEYVDALKSIVPPLSDRRMADLVRVAETKLKPAEAFGG